MSFITDDFLLPNRTAQALYQTYAAPQPIYDYHCHLSPRQIAEDTRFENLTQIWLNEDHYKWRAMRANGIDERFCTGAAGDYEKFEQWAATVPYAMRNPLYHWTHLELKRYFGIRELLNPASARKIYDTCGEMLRSPQFSARHLLRRLKVRVVCTTDDPLDSLEHHRKIRADDFEVAVFPTWRPDQALAVENLPALNDWLDRLAALTGLEIRTFQTCLEALRRRHDFFHAQGCRLSDHSLDTAYAVDYTHKEISAIFDKIRTGRELYLGEQMQFKSALLLELARMDFEKGWVQQFHLGPLRNNHSRMFQLAGPDAGFDSFGDSELARPLARFLDRLAAAGQLAQTILYNLNPAASELIAAMLGNFQDGSCPGKMQYGPAWWFQDRKDGIERHLHILSAYGLLSRFVGMVTDSRSFLSYPRHEYFRRILCGLLGSEMENGQLPNDLEWIGEMVRNICYYNAEKYFPLTLKE